MAIKEIVGQVIHVFHPPTGGENSVELIIAQLRWETYGN